MMATKKSSDRDVETIAAKDVGALEDVIADPPFGITFHGTTPPPGFVERDGVFVEFKTAEEWAATKGMTPQYIPVPAPFASARALARKQLNPAFLSYAQARAHFSWPIGKELTEAEFDAAVTAATTNIYR